MPEQNDPHEERLKEAAQRHADKWNEHGYLDADGEPYLLASTSEMMDEANTTVSMQAEAIMEALRAWGVREEDIHNHLLENGYIPRKED